MLLFLYHVHNVANTVNRYDSPTSICSAEKGNGDSPKDTRNWFASATRRIIVLITVALSILNFSKFNIMKYFLYFYIANNPSKDVTKAPIIIRSIHVVLDSILSIFCAT